MTILIKFATSIPARVVAEGHKRDEQEPVDKLDSKLLDQVQACMNKLVDNLSERALKASSLHYAGVDATTIRKPGHAAVIFPKKSPYGRQSPWHLQMHLCRKTFKCSKIARVEASGFSKNVLEATVAEPASIDDYLSCQRYRDYVNRLSTQDMKMVQNIAAVERAKKDKIILYHAMSPMQYFLAWILHCLVSNQPIEWKGGFSDANMAAINFRVFGEHDVFPAFNDSSDSRNNKFVDVLAEQELKKSGVGTVADFVAYSKRQGIFGFFGGMPDHQAGVRDRLLSTNINLFGNLKTARAESSWYMFHTLFANSFWSTSGSFGDEVNFLESICSSLGSSAEVQERAERQLDLLNNLFYMEPDEISSRFDFLNSVKTLFNSSTVELVSSLARRPSPAKAVKYKFQKDVKYVDDPPGTVACNTFPTKRTCQGVLLQLILAPEKADQLVYVSGCAGVPDAKYDISSFSKTYRKVKNRMLGDAGNSLQPRVLLRQMMLGEVDDSLQARVLLRRDPFASGDDGVQFVAHSAKFADRAFTQTVVAILDEVKQTLQTHHDMS